MKILIDHQIYQRQKFGGINRYFDEIKKMEESNIQIEDYLPIRVPMKFDFYSKATRLIKRNLGIKERDLEKETVTEMKAKVMKGDFDIFHPTYYDPYFLENTNKPFVLTVYDMIHEIYKEYFDPSDPTSIHKRLLCNKATKIISISENTRRDLIDIFGIPEEKVQAILLASDFDKILPREPKNSQGLERFILYTGNRWGYKNFYYPVMALAEILKNDKDLQLLCSGYSFSQAELSFFKDLGIEGQVRNIYLEDDSELAWAYRHASLFIFPSLYEGFGFPLLEAFASNCPVISSSGGSLKEVGGNGALYFDPKSFPEIRDTAYKALYDNTLRTQLIENGKQIFKKYSWEKCRAETADLYQSLM